MSERVVILGATSGIARAVAGRLAGRGDRLVLAGRNTPELERIAADLRTRHGVGVDLEPFDALAGQTHADLARRCLGRCDGAVDGLVVCQGYMPEQAAAESDAFEAQRTLRVTLESVVTVVEPVAAAMADRGAGWIAVISSVAGDRGRQSNYIYGAAKAGLNAYCQGLRNRLFRRGVHVLTIKPGFVATAMTQGLVNPDSPLVASPDKVAGDIVRAIEKRRNVLYTPWFWRGIMRIIRSIPEPVFKRMKL